MSDLLGISIGYVIAITTVLGSAAVIALLSLKAIVKAWAFFKPSTPKKIEIQSPWETSEPSLWICLYCTTNNNLEAISCSRCGSPRQWTE